VRTGGRIVDSAETEEVLMKVLGILLMVWVILVPVLGITAFVLWLRRTRAGLPVWRNVLGVTSVVAVLLNWILFLWLAWVGQIGGFGTHYMTTRSADEFSMITLGAFAMSFFLRSKSRVFATIASALMFALWGGAELVA